MTEAESYRTLGLSTQDPPHLRWREHAESIAAICWEKQVLGEEGGYTFRHFCGVGEKHEIMRAVLVLNQRMFRPSFNIEVTQEESVLHVVPRTFAISWKLD
jgi:hypothetical protein